MNFIDEFIDNNRWLGQLLAASGEQLQSSDTLIDFGNEVIEGYENQLAWDNY